MAKKTKTPEIKLDAKVEKKLFKKFSKFAKVLRWTNKDTYYIHANTRILKSEDTADLFNQLKEAYQKDNTVEIW